MPTQHFGVVQVLLLPGGVAMVRIAMMIFLPEMDLLYRDRRQEQHQQQ